MRRARNAVRCQNDVDRSNGRMFIATAQPPFTSPRMRSAGTTTSSKNTSANSGAPLSSSNGRTVIPGVSMSTKNAVMPRCADPGGPVRVSSTQRGRVLRQAGPQLLPVDHPVVVAAGSPGTTTRRGRSRCRARRTPGTTSCRRGAAWGSPRGRARAARTRRASAPGPRSSSRSPASTSPRAVTSSPSTARQDRRAAEPAHRFGPAPPHPPGVEQGALHPRQLRHLLVERSLADVRRDADRRRARRATRPARCGTPRSPRGACSPGRADASDLRYQADLGGVPVQRRVTGSSVAG